MIFESYFIIRGGTAGYDWGLKLILGIVALSLAFYDWKTNNKRLDYIWVFLTGTIIWMTIELIGQLGGTRVLQKKYLFGLDITPYLWLTIPIQAMCEGSFYAVVGLFLGDRFLNRETRAKSIVFLIIAMAWYVPYAVLNAGEVNVGGIVPSRREMFTMGQHIIAIIIIMILSYWLIKAENHTRKRALYMFLMTATLGIWWNLMDWATGNRWVEIGIKNSDGTYSNLRRAHPIIEFSLLLYDGVVEIAMAYLAFMAVPFILGRIESEQPTSQ
jgi:hypothetical protein